MPAEAKEGTKTSEDSQTLPRLDKYHLRGETDSVDKRQETRLRESHPFDPDEGVPVAGIVRYNPSKLSPRDWQVPHPLPGGI
jgi:hypothetical protein